MSLEALYATALLIMHLYTLFHSPCICTHCFIHFALLLNIYCTHSFIRCAFVHILCIHHAFIHTVSFAVHLYIHTLGFLVESGDYGGPS